MKDINGIQCPTCLADIPVGRFVEASKYNTDTTEGMDMKVCALCGLTIEQFNNLPVAVSLALTCTILDFDAEIPKPSMEIDIQGTTYKLQKAEKLRTREFIDLDTLQAENNIERLPMLVALMYDDGEEHKDYVSVLNHRAEVFAECMTADVALSALRFFVQTSKDYAEHMLVSSGMVALNKARKKKPTTDLTDGAGS